MDPYYEQQTAPESTRGLFDTPVNVTPRTTQSKRQTTADKRRSIIITPSGMRRDDGEVQLEDQASGLRTHRRTGSAFSRDSMPSSAVFNNRQIPGTTTYSEQRNATDADNTRRNSKRVSRNFGQEAASEGTAMDNLQNIITTLKGLPPRGQEGQEEVQPQQRRPQQRRTGGDAEYEDRSTYQMSDQERAAERRDKRRSILELGKNRFRQAEDESEGYTSREQAIAEAEAKLMGTYVPSEEQAQQYVDSETLRLRRLSEPSNRAQGVQSFQDARDKRRSVNLSSLAENATGLQKLGPSQHGLPPLSEGYDDGNTLRQVPPRNRRIQFNKPLNLVPEDNSGRVANKRSSRNFDSDWRSGSYSAQQSQQAAYNNLVYSPRNSKFNIVPFTPNRVSFARDDANPNQRRPLFTAHLPFSALTPLLKSRQLIRGQLRVNKRNRSDAYVMSEDLDADIFICGSRDRNRALDGDVVAVKLVDVDKVLREKKDKEEAKIARNGGQARQRKPDDEDETEIYLEGDDNVDVVKPKYCGVIVAVLERPQNQMFSGMLGLSRPNNKRAAEGKTNDDSEERKDTPRIVWFKPTDKRVPLIAIPIEQVPEGFVEHHQDFANRLFLGSIKRWPITSLHPFGTLEKELGKMGQLNIESQALMADHNITDTEFGEAVLKCLPAAPWSIPESEKSARRDFSGDTMFTVDSPGAKYLEDALSITSLGNGNFEVALHVVDVSYFIKPQNPLDKEARNRAVSTQLVETVIPMLPSQLTDELCNLYPGTERLAFSIVWKMNTEGQVLDTWFGKSIVRSSARLTFHDVQQVLDGKDVEGLASSEDLKRGISDLNVFAKKLRSARFDSGALALDEINLSFELNEQGEPVSVSLKKETDADILVNEFLLLANISVAQRISSHFPEQALLRRHPGPLDRRLNQFLDYASRLGYDFDGGSAGGLQRSFNSIQDAGNRQVLELLAGKVMQKSKYFCTGTLDIMKYLHYSLNVPLFTHFSAPLSRYADIVVHRQLQAALEGEKRFYLDRDTVQKTAAYCNTKMANAKLAEEASKQLYLSKYLEDLTSNRGLVTRQAIVMAVLEQAFDIVVPDFGLERRVHLDNLPLKASKFDAASYELTLSWEKGAAVAPQHDQTQEPGYIDTNDGSDVEDELTYTSTNDASDTSKLTDNVRKLAVEESKADSHDTPDDDHETDQTILPFTKLTVGITIDKTKSPPVIKVLPVNPTS
ncbi:hypothetical protein BZG36_04053 [Bifiguratus adelaidae]|uniref:RNB domain-containing protein n=1 Tax=Bifiguratus adelaidae TaxID=1938954 RepID=A0A261XWG5_9FUNG|nr:hypothetical protein BZG36_04053 [Bifiguratus adelaidae]